MPALKKLATKRQAEENPRKTKEYYEKLRTNQKDTGNKIRNTDDIEE